MQPTSGSGSLRLAVGQYLPTGTPHNVVGLAEDDLRSLGLTDHEWVDVISSHVTVRARIRCWDATAKAPVGTILLTSRLTRALGLTKDEREVEVVPFHVAQLTASVGVARVELVGSWDEAACVPGLAPNGSRRVEIMNPRTHDSAVLHLLPAKSAESSSDLALSWLQKRLIRWEKGDQVVIRDADLPHLEGPSTMPRGRGAALAVGEALVGARRLPGRVHPANPVESVAEVAQVARPLWVALGLQDGDRIVCAANGRHVTRRVAPRDLPEVEPQPQDSDPLSENATQLDFALYLDQPARVALGLDRRERDTVVVFRDPVAAMSRSLSAGLISALLSGISVAQADAILGTATGPVAVVVAVAVFYFALNAERSRVD